MSAIGKLFGGGTPKPVVQPTIRQPDPGDMRAREVERTARADNMRRQGRESTDLSSGSYMSQFLGQ